MDIDWADAVLSASQRRDEAEEDCFLALVDQADGRCTLEVARVLMKTFSDVPDYGTQERVRSVLAGALPEVAIRGGSKSFRGSLPRHLNGPKP